MKIFLRQALLASFFFGGGLLFFIFFGFSKTEKALEVERLVIKNPQSKACIEMQVIGDQPIIAIKDKQGAALGTIMIDQQGVFQLSLNDQNSSPRLELRGGDYPSLFILDTKQEMLGGFFPISEGGSGIVLCNKNNKLSTLIRGGDNPGINFYEKEEDPTIALGIISTVPHFLLSGKYSTDGVLIHGGEPTSLLFLDGKGEVQVAVSRLGFYARQMQDTDKGPERPQYFSLDKLKKQIKEIDNTKYRK